MRLAGLIGALAQAAIWIDGAAPSHAQTTATAPLAANEVLFEVNVVGKARTPADFAIANVNYRASGNSPDSARRNAEDLERRLLDGARQFGAERQESANPFGIVPFANEITIIQGGSEEGVSVRPDTPFWGFGGFTLRLGGTGRFQDLRRAMETAGALNVNGPINVLVDDQEARRRARNDALQRARAEAEQFASAQGMRVVRMLRFSESSDNSAAMMQSMMRIAGSSAASGSDVETLVSAQVAFALAAR